MTTIDARGISCSLVTLDACGVSCPEPLVMLKSTLPTVKELTILVDNKASYVNCVEYAEKQGCRTELRMNEDIYELRIVKE